jgi:hypothetical protein
MTDENGIAPEEELFSLNRHKSLKKLGYVDIEGDEYIEK